MTRDQLIETMADAWIGRIAGHDPRTVSIGDGMTAVLTAIEAAGMRVDAGWQPIETAPKNGTEILAWHSGLAMGAMVLSWFDGGWREKANMMRLKTGPHFWMPLPTPPQEDSTSE